MFRFLAVLGIYFGLLVSAAAAPDISAQEAPPEHIWLADSDGVSVHMVSGLRCPQKAGAYKLDELVTIDRPGFNVACFYKNPAGEIVSLGIFMRRDGVDFDADFAQLKSVFLKSQKETVEVALEQSPVLPRNTSWRSQGHRQADGKRGGIWMTDYAGWGLYLTAMHAPKNANQAMEAMRLLAVAADTTARERLQTCARNLPSPGKGKLLPDEPIALATQALALLKYQEVVREGKSAPTRWCVLGYSVDDLSMVVWHNVGPDAPVRPVFRITFEADKGPVIFYVVRDSYAVEYFNEEHGYKSAPHDAHVLIGYVGDAAAFGAFDYEPEVKGFMRRVSHVIKERLAPGIRVDKRGDIWVQGEKIPPEAFRRGR